MDDFSWWQGFLDTKWLVCILSKDENLQWFDLDPSAVSMQLACINTIAFFRILEATPTFMVGQRCHNSTVDRLIITNCTVFGGYSQASIYSGSCFRYAIKKQYILSSHKNWSLDPIWTSASYDHPRFPFKCFTPHWGYTGNLEDWIRSVRSCMHATETAYSQLQHDRLKSCAPAAVFSAGLTQLGAGPAAKLDICQSSLLSYAMLTLAWIHLWSIWRKV